MTRRDRMRCERCGEALVHEDEQVDGECRKCSGKARRKARGKAMHGKKKNHAWQVPVAKRAE